MLDNVSDLINIGNQFVGGMSVSASPAPSGLSGGIGALSTTNFSFEDLYNNLVDTFIQTKRLIFAVSYVMGVFLVLRGIMMYRIFANQTFGSAQRGEMAGPLVHIVVGAILVYFPSAIDTSLMTVFGDDNILEEEYILGYASLRGNQNWERISTLIIYYMHLIGIIAFLRGWVILSKMAHSGSQPGSIGKGLTHIIGGVLLINIVQTVNIIATTFGYS